MTRQNNKAKEISLGEDFGDVTVKVNGVRVEVHTDGSVLAYTNNAVKVLPIANDDGKSAAPAEPTIGDKMPDGTVYAGISPDTKMPMYATFADAPLTMSFNQATTVYAPELDAHGHRDWRVPTIDELKVLFNNRVAIGGFKLKRSILDPAGWYVSSTPRGEGSDGVWGQRFSAGDQVCSNGKEHPASVRCVR
jgi:hypothetical protein